jgi:hypothetical protein
MVNADNGSSRPARLDIEHRTATRDDGSRVVWLHQVSVELSADRGALIGPDERLRFEL